ncbi:MAG TPA: tetratricopeptide repeat protein [Candidatus Angelobacter sp.]|nr:tetratricopeptide repeat protein [Candidatus Angelobacter sp.]
MTDKSKLIWLAERQMNLANPRGAIEPLRKVLAEDPNHALAHAYMAACLHDTGHHRDARAAAATALGLAPEMAFAHYIAGTIALLQKDHGAAEQHLTQARTLAPADSRIYRQLARLYRETDRKRLVLPTLEEGLSHAPQNTGLLADIGKHFVDAGKTAAAEAKAREVLQIDPESIDGNVLMGHVRLHQGDIEGAREHSLIALNKDATDYPALHLLCSIKVRMNPLLGLWWHYSVWSLRLGKFQTSLVATAVLLVLFLVQVAVDQNGGPGLVILLWFGYAFYTSIGSRLFNRALRRELEAVRLKHNY